jgi:preprotein translocase subunit Sec63
MVFISCADAWPTAERARMITFNAGDIDPHLILGIPTGADAATIKKAYRRLAKKYHPDVNPENSEAAEHFKQVQHAYETLMQESCVNPDAGFAAYPNTDDPHPFFAFSQALHEFWSKNKL